MGKQKRIRQKYHLASTKTSDGEKNDADSKPASCGVPLPWNIEPSDNMFSGLDINLANLRKSLIDDDGKSVKSLSKSIKSSSGRLLKKEDKMKLKHNLFIKKIDAIYENIRDSKKRKKTKATKNEVMDTSTIEYLLNKQPGNFKKIPAASFKHKGIQKTKQRKEIMLKDINLFKKVLSDPNFVSKPLEHIRSSVENKLLTDAI